MVFSAVLVSLLVEEVTRECKPPVSRGLIVSCPLVRVPVRVCSERLGYSFTTRVLRGKMWLRARLPVGGTIGFQMCVFMPLQENSGLARILEFMLLEETGWCIWDKERMERLQCH